MKSKAFQDLNSGYFQREPLEPRLSPGQRGQRRPRARQARPPLVDARAPDDLRSALSALNYFISNLRVGIKLRSLLWF